jgi:hypothetical protein
MIHRASKTLLSALPYVLWAGALAACSSDGAGSGGGGGSGTTTSGSGGATGSVCGGAKVTIAFFSDAACSDANKTGQRAYDTSLDCFSWTAQGSNAQENSATRFQCYNDRLCYTQHAGTLTCSGGSTGPTDKQAKNGVCIKEPSGTLYSLLVGGNEACPPPPAGFECPTSASEMGTDGIEACVTAP